MNRRGQALVEYILIIALISVIAIALVNYFGGYLKDAITKTSCSLVDEEYIKGYGTGTWEELFEIAQNYADEGNYKDIVSQTISDEKLDVEMKTFNELYAEPNKAVIIVVYSIFGLIVLGFGAMIIFSRK